MSFIRFSSRCLLSGYFVVDGLKAAIDPEPLVDEAEPYARKFTSYVDRVLPAGVARRVPSKTVTLVRLHGIVQAAGALMMATGLFRRWGAVIVAASYLPKVASRHPSTSDDVLPFAEDLAVLGGVMLEAGNKGTHGRACCRSQKKKTRKANAAAASSAKAAAKKDQSRQTDALRHILSSATS